jgi:hypothetical protein
MPRPRLGARIAHAVAGVDTTLSIDGPGCEQQAFGECRLASPARADKRDQPSANPRTN